MVASRDHGLKEKTDYRRRLFDDSVNSTMIACLAYVLLLLVAIYEDSTLQRLAAELFAAITYFWQ